MKRVYLFEEGSKDMIDLLGNKGAQLCEMSRIGIPVPPGFVISTEACREYFKERKLSEELKKEIEEALKVIEERTGKKFGDRKNPLLVSVRSGAPISMPGMMDTILNLGLNDEIVEEMAKKDAWFAYDTYRRFLYMFGSIVLSIDERKFEEILEKKKEEEGVELDQELSVEALKEVVEEYKKLLQPPLPKKQLFMAVEAVFKSWNNPRAIEYRRINNLPEDIGTGVVVQTMVFGNMGDDSLSGVAFTRDPSTGEKKLYGEFIINGQGEDIVSGKRTPLPIKELEKIFPHIYEELCEMAEKLEKHYKDMQDMEFTVEKGKLYMLQTRTGKRTARAAVKIAVDMVKEGIISREEAIKRIEPNSLQQLLHKQIKKDDKIKVIATGLPASPGAATGKICFSADEAAKIGDREKIILVREETTPDDIHGIVKAQGVLTVRGGITSHAAVVSRGLGIPCVVGCGSLKINEEEGYMKVNGIILKEGSVLTIDGTTGQVILGKVELIDAKFTDELKVLLEWADEFRRLRVYANADLPKDAEKAVYFGAEGIGLCRTEHMFLGKRLPIVRKMILDESKKQEALNELLERQRKDFIELFKIMNGKPVVIRLLDAPLHEFLPRYEEMLEKEIKEELTEEEKRVLDKIKELREVNPMLGFRGVRVAILHPEIYRMQARAIIEAAIMARKEGYEVLPYIEIPIVSEINEIVITKEHIIDEIEEVFEEKGEKIDYKIGTMIELPRACIIADEIAKEVDFISFGTNDLTQTTFGYSRDDAGKEFLEYYVQNKVLPHDPFAVLDEKGVGSLMKMAVEKARKIKGNEIEISICGEHGGEPRSIKFCHDIGIDAVSCSPFRVAIARLAAAQAALE
ncbi:MAG: pyruvate, phosphate dikinase [Thermoplasmata archaeon]|nr:MAG: pyruvate, phosphate dikinase [Thermoplasmata archaeon]HDN95947.1 pyruvate, phosphate dikinase [Thermoplasmatales archaeon]